MERKAASPEPEGERARETGRARLEGTLRARLSGSADAAPSPAPGQWPPPGDPAWLVRETGGAGAPSPAPEAAPLVEGCAVCGCQPWTHPVVWAAPEDCGHFLRCRDVLGVATRGQRECDWEPIRFKAWWDSSAPASPSEHGGRDG